MEQQQENRYGLNLSEDDYAALLALVNNQRARNCRNADEYGRWSRIDRALRTASTEGQ